MSPLNPLIAEKSYDTLANVHSVTSFVSEFLEEQQYKDFPITVNSQIAMSLVLLCTNSAISYEMERLEMAGAECEVQNNSGSLHEPQQADLQQAGSQQTDPKQKPDKTASPAGAAQASVNATDDAQTTKDSFSTTTQDSSDAGQLADVSKTPGETTPAVGIEDQETKKPESLTSCTPPLQKHA